MTVLLILSVRHYHALVERSGGDDATRRAIKLVPVWYCVLLRRRDSRIVAIGFVYQSRTTEADARGTFRDTRNEMSVVKVLARVVLAVGARER